MQDGVLPVVFKNSASRQTLCLLKFFCLCLSTSTLPSCLKYAYIQLVPKKGGHFNISHYCPIALLFYLSKAFEIVLNFTTTKCIGIRFGEWVPVGHCSVVYTETSRDQRFYSQGEMNGKYLKTGHGVSHISCALKCLNKLFGLLVIFSCNKD